MWTTGQQGKWIDLHALRQSADWSNLGLRVPDEPECATKKPRRRLNWPAGKLTNSSVRWQPTRNGNCASEGFSQAQKSFAISEVPAWLEKSAARACRSSGDFRRRIATTTWVLPSLRSHDIYRRAGPRDGNVRRRDDRIRQESAKPDDPTRSHHSQSSSMISSIFLSFGSTIKSAPSCIRTCEP